MRSDILVVAALRTEMPRRLAGLGVATCLVGPRARLMGPGGLPGRGPVLVVGSCGALVTGVAPASLLLATTLLCEGDEALVPDTALVGALERALASARVPWRATRLVQAAEVIEGDGRTTLALETGAEAADLESATIARLCRAAGRPWAVLRYVADAPEAPLTFLGEILGSIPEEEPRIGRLLAGIARRPSAVPDLVALGLRMARGRARVRRVIALLPA